MVLMLVLAGCSGGEGPGDSQDPAAPTVTVSTPPQENAVTNADSASFTIASDVPATLCWNFDGGAETCSAPGVGSVEVAFAELTPGSHTLEVTATDAAGRSASVIRHWTVDADSPTTTITSTVIEGALLNTTSAIFTLDASEPATICWNLDGGAATCSAAGRTTLVAELSALDEGEHSLSVTTTDLAGNASTATRRWTVDSVAPSVSISRPPEENARIDTNSVTLTLGIDEPGTLCWALDGGAPICSTDSVTSFTAALDGLSEGSHTLTVTARDDAGNSASASRRWTVDTASPTITVSAPPADGAVTSSTSATFTIATDEPATICWRLDSGAWTCSQPGVTTFAATLFGLPAGNHCLTVTASDALANETVKTRSWTVAF